MASSDLFEQPAPSRYVVGIDLGTTNSALCYVDTAENSRQVHVFAAPQLIAPAQIEARETLPSFHYEPSASEHAAGTLKLPWSTAEQTACVGVMARDWGGRVSGRMIASAKSWLCHSGVDRSADLLPWHGADDVERLSPVAVSSRYLKHYRDAWNHRFPAHPLEEQDLVLTLPASFDEVARSLTIEAAAQAGLSRVVLIEEPQAAFYAWINKHRDDWEQQVSPGQKILVCDVGGGTTDFTLIRVRRGNEGKVQFHRVAVGEHLILGGDNFDLALARLLEEKLAGGGKLPPRQWDLLIRVARDLKEEMLAENAPHERSISLPATGSRLIGGARQVVVSCEEVRRVLVDGFFPVVPLDARPDVRRSGFQEFGLPYAADSAVSKYLAAFLTTHRHAGLEPDAPQTGDPARPDILLFNGGVFLSPLLQTRLVDLLSAWFSPPGKPWRPLVLQNDRLDLAVARGAAYYGMVRRGEGVKITAALARTYYIGFESTPPAAICLVPGNAEAGQEIELPARKFDLLVSEPVEFPLYVSSTRLDDKPGQLLPVDLEQMTPLPPIRTALKTRRRSERGLAEVTLHARLTEIGTLDLWCAEVAGERQWRLQFDIRSATETDRAAHQSAGETQGVVDETAAQALASEIAATFGDGASKPPETLMKRLAELLGLDRRDWPPTLLRRIWEELLACEAGRRKSPAHEARWLNLLGYALRPGFGLAVDDWRVAETWKAVQGKLAFAAPSSRTEASILWRRIAGGFTAGQQRAVAEPLLASIRAIHKKLTTGKGDIAFRPQDQIEPLRLLGGLELLPGPVKLELGGSLIDLARRKKLGPLLGAALWTIGRLGARQPVYGPLNTVLSPAAIAPWLEALLTADWPDDSLPFAVVQLARRTDDRYRDLDDSLRERVLAWLAARSAPEALIRLVRKASRLEQDEAARVFGEALPKGLRIR